MTFCRLYVDVVTRNIGLQWVTVLSTPLLGHVLHCTTKHTFLQMDILPPTKHIARCINSSFSNVHTMGKNA